MEKFEYKTIITPSLDIMKIWKYEGNGQNAQSVAKMLEKEAIELGNQGWELVSTAPYTWTRRIASPIQLISIFKRKIK